ncbi:MAG: glycosyltransferase family 2 protein [Verrucomicrobia bacterium]|nr:glycosyltransferase family 2 protein [Verrucomicrobiota bacterium]
MPRISAIVITRNEEERLPRCLKSLQWADQIVVVDSGSTDRTVDVARSYRAEVFTEEWKGYTAQKNSALAKATGDWVVSLDADEEFSPKAMNDVQKLAQADDPSVQAYAFRRKVFYLGRWIRHGDWYPDYVVRLWRRGSGRFEGGHVHESVQVSGTVKHLRSEILHYTYRDLEDQKARLRKYALLWAQDQFDRKRPVAWSDLCLRPPARFLRAILLKSGWMDGWRGWLIAWMCAREVRLKYRNLRDLWHHHAAIGKTCP